MVTGTARVPPSGSASLLRTSMSTGLCWVVVAVSSLATGGKLGRVVGGGDVVTMRGASVVAGAGPGRAVVAVVAFGADETVVVVVATGTGRVVVESRGAASGTVVIDVAGGRAGAPAAVPK